MNDLLHTLTEIWGPSGHEGQVRETIQDLLAGHVDDMRVDAMGNLITRIAPARGAGDGPASGGGISPAGGDPRPLRIMLAAHMDEIGVIVTHIDDKGFLRFAAVGGVLIGNLIGTRVEFEDGAVGVIGSEKRDDTAKAPKLDELFIDVGAATKDAVTQKVGDAAAFRHGLDWAGGRPVTPNLDDRIGCVVLVETLRRLAPGPNEVFGVFTVQEEIGVRGATTSAYGVAPNLAIAIDVTGTGDTPEARKMAVSLGLGPAIKVKDGGMIAHRGVRALMERRAAEAGIPYQLEVLLGGTTDAMSIQTSRAGVPSGVVSIPSRYIHTPSQLVDMADVENAVRLLVGVVGQGVELG
jgi:putative aminopeptidase FrvX